MPSTRQPLARSSCTVSRPISPRPVTTKRSPSVGCGEAHALQRDRAEHRERRLVVGHAVGNARAEIARHRSPVRRAGRSRRRDRRARSRRHLAADLDTCRRCSSPAASADRACCAPRRASGNRPSVRILSSTCSTLSGCWRALSIQPARPNSTSMRSVPAEISVRVVRISKPPRGRHRLGDFGEQRAPVPERLQDLSHRSLSLVKKRTATTGSR